MQIRASVALLDIAIQQTKPTKSGDVSEHFDNFMYAFGSGLYVQCLRFMWRVMNALWLKYEYHYCLLYLFICYNILMNTSMHANAQYLLTLPSPY